MQTLSLPNDNKMQLESQQTSMNGGWESQNHINIADYPNTTHQPPCLDSGIESKVSVLSTFQS